MNIWSAYEFSVDIVLSRGYERQIDENDCSIDFQSGAEKVWVFLNRDERK